MGDQQQLRAVQLRELEILKVIMEICERHGLRYFADSGTCLGAIRHGGFIPWDDDLDIGMPRADFEKFRAIARQELPPYLALLDFEEVQRTTRMFLKVHDTRTTFIEKRLVPYPNLHTGVWVDIFPYDGWLAPGLKKSWMVARIRLLQSISWVLRKPYSEAKNLVGKLQFWLFTPLKRFLPFNWASLRLERLLRKYPAEETPYAAIVLERAWVCPSDCILRTEKRPFEDVEIPCPADYDTYLTCFYGDYMTPPPEEKRNSGHTVVLCDLAHSYLDMQDEIRRLND